MRIRVCEGSEWKWYNMQFDMFIYDDNELIEHWRNCSLITVWGLCSYYRARMGVRDFGWK